MKQTKWLISLSACLFLMAASSAAPFPHLFDREGGRFDPVALFAAILL